VVAVIVPVIVGLAEFALELTAVWMLLNSVLISVPFTILAGLPEAKESLVAKLVVFV
jgi:predicted cobalt transporter CbtA